MFLPLPFRVDREFFANRAAAQAVKAKVEAYERNGGERVNMPLIGGGGYTSASNAVAAPSNGGVRSHPNSRRGSEVDRDYNYAAEEASVYEQPSSYRGGRRSHADADNEMSEAERRIAQIKLQRDRDRERENAEKEMQVSLCFVLKRLNGFQFTSYCASRLYS
jgi:hypothetical protein